MHRITYWLDDEDNARQVEVACLDGSWECHVAIVRQVGPFDELPAVVAQMRDEAHACGGYHAHQQELWSS